MTFRRQTRAATAPRAGIGQNNFTLSKKCPLVPRPTTKPHFPSFERDLAQKWTSQGTPLTGPNISEIPGSGAAAGRKFWGILRFVDLVFWAILGTTFSGRGETLCADTTSHRQFPVRVTFGAQRVPRRTRHHAFENMWAGISIRMWSLWTPIMPPRRAMLVPRRVKRGATFGPLGGGHGETGWEL